MCQVDAILTLTMYTGKEINYLFDDGRLKLQPLCYDMATHMMVSPKKFTELGANSSTWIFYFNNNPIIASSSHPFIELALAQATLTLEKYIKRDLPEIQSTAGPGNLTKSIFDIAINDSAVQNYLLILNDWEDTASSKWELSYRNDARNWRLSNCKAYNENDLKQNS